MDFNFIDSSKIVSTNLSYKDFDSLVMRNGYVLEINGFLHNYFDWKSVQCWSLDYYEYSSEQLSTLFLKSKPYAEALSFFIRLHQGEPIIKINSKDLASMLEDLCFETGMGWEGISTDGKYIIEFTDSFEHLVKSNFRFFEQE